MDRQFDHRSRFAGSFIAALVLAYWLARRGGEQRIKSEIASSLGMAGGLLAGYKLAQRAANEHRSSNTTPNG